MATDSAASTKKISPLEFKSTSYTVPILVVFDSDLKQLEYQLDEKISQALEFFKNSPVLIDLKELNLKQQTIDLVKLIECLQTKKLFPIGICSGNENQQSIALDLNIPSHTLKGTIKSNQKKSTKKLPTTEFTDNPKENSSDKEEPSSIVENMLICQPIRSGQRVYAKGDLTILSHVSAGAEVMAEGNIHIYGTLRGRALAGVQGNTESRIFCLDLQAELISIAGHYKTSEEMDSTEKNKPTQIYLENQALITSSL